MHVKWSVTWTDWSGPEFLTVLKIKGQVLHHVRWHGKVPGWLLNLNALLTKKYVFVTDRFSERLRDIEKKTTQMCPNQSRAIFISPITPTTTWLSAGYPYTTETQKAAKVSNKSSFFNWVHSHHTELMNTSHCTINLFTNSCDHNFHRWQSSSTLSY